MGKLKIALATAAAMVLTAVAAQAQTAQTAQEAANKELVLKFWSQVFDHQDVAKARLYLSEDYKQHNPLIPNGLAGFEAHFGKFWPKPLPADKVKPIHFDLVMVDGNLVTTVMRYPRPDRDNPGKTYDTFWFDTMRVENGKLVEHWDNAQKPGDNLPPE